MHWEHGLADVGFDVKHGFHAGPIIRREEDYQNLSITDRGKCLNRILTFAKSCDMWLKEFPITLLLVKSTQSEN